MNIFRRVTHWLQHQGEAFSQTTNIVLNDKLEQARRAQYTERFDEALELFAEALSLAEAQHNETVITDIILSRADIFIAREEYNAAAVILNNLRETCENRQLRAPLAYTLTSLGVIEQKRGHIDAARAYFEKARDIAEIIHTDGAAGRAIAHLGDTYLIEGNASYAIYLLQDAIPKLVHSGDRELLGYFQGSLGDALIASGQPNEGIEAIQQGLESARSLNYQAQIRGLSQKLGIHSLQLGDSSKAISYLEDAHKLYDKHTISPDYILLLCHLSRALYHTGKFRESLNYASQAYELVVNFQQPKLIAIVTAAFGLSLSAMGQAEKALPLLQTAEQAYSELASDAFYMDILRNLALSQLKSGDSDNAHVTYQKAIEKGRLLPLQLGQIYTDRAQFVAERGDYKTALEYHTTALRYYMDSNQRYLVAHAYAATGTLYMQLGDGKMARREYEQALIQLNNMGDITTRGHVLALVANAYTEFGDMESADAFYKEAIEIARRDNAKQDEAARRGDYGRFLALTHKPKQAITEIMQARNRFDELGLIIESGIQVGNLGLAYAVLKEHEKALHHYEIGLGKLENNPRACEIRANRADTYAMLSQYDEAQSEYQSTLIIARTASNYVVVVQSILGLAQIAVEAHSLEVTEAYIREAESLIRRANLRRLQAHLLLLQSRLYAAQGEMEKAQSGWEEAAKLRSILRQPELSPDWL